ncbi:hypothetical protein B0A49_10181 [Cryomyces minteri]|uniref:S1 motif domain-containing protein n=1 Tax=Cryomyces minteri TaxID=331657 RepID=A0A4U0WBU6_9PEZI|nr:hypothetical protein B0A49_10181 [Cryomyces minteri]
MALPTLALPGQPLGPTSKYTAGPGTHVQSAQIIASICGPVLTSRPHASSSSSSTSAAGSKPSKTTPLPLKVLSVSRTPLPASTTAASTVSATSAAETSNVLPEVNNVVLAKVVRVMARQATVEILVVGDGVVREGFQGVVRVQDIRATEKDKVKVGESFRVGDVVRGIVISLGDQSNYYLSTARNDLGVIMATSEAGNQMYPISWKEFRDPKSGVVEARKVAKPF